jgi:DNA polymerase V
MQKKTRQGVLGRQSELVQEMLSETAVTEIWESANSAVCYCTMPYSAAADFIKAPEDWVRTNLSVVGLRLLYELRAFPPSAGRKTQAKNICTSNLWQSADKKEEVQEALVNYAAACAEKLRAQKHVAK